MAEQEATGSEQENKVMVSLGLKPEAKPMAILDNAINDLSNCSLSTVITPTMLDRNSDLYTYLSYLPDGEYFKRMVSLYHDFNSVLAENLAFKKHIDLVNKQHSGLVAELMRLNIEKCSGPGRKMGRQT